MVIEFVKIPKDEIKVLKSMLEFGDEDEYVQNTIAFYKFKQNGFFIGKDNKFVVIEDKKIKDFYENEDDALYSAKNNQSYIDCIGEPCYTKLTCSSP
jgi:hypothetical protein